jgi:uncharacterized membrane protein
MVKLAEGSTELSLHKPQEVGLAQARILWVMRPLGLLGLVLWVLHPGIADQTEHAHHMLLGFVMGAGYGLIVYGSLLARYLRLRPPTERQQSNRVPNEYYWGQIEQILYRND